MLCSPSSAAERWAAGAAARGTEMRARTEEAAGAAREVAALLTAAEEGDERARERLSTAWVVRLPLAFFHDGDEDWRNRREPGPRSASGELANHTPPSRRRSLLDPEAMCVHTYV